VKAPDGASFTLVGHSERRIAFGERSHDIWGKAMAARREGLGVILCCGENEGQRDVGRATNLVDSQIELSVPHDAAADWLTIAYEPTWAIGTGRTPTHDDIVAMHGVIRTKLCLLLGAERGESIRILYGGSVSPTNAAAIMALDNVDGALVGGASLAAASFVPIIEAAAAIA
jgi:triosephosphate isomerase